MFDSSDEPRARVPDEGLTAGFLSKFGHEVRSPLNAIIGFSEMLGDEAFGPLTDEQREVARDIRDAGRHLQQLVSDALDVSRLRLRKMELSCDILSVAAVVEQALAMTAAIASERDTQLSHTVPMELAVTADDRRLTQVLCNLLRNAVLCSPEGATVHVSAERRGDVVRISVADTGPGIPSDEQERVFEPFVAMDREGRTGGTGLGLPLSYGLVELMGGTMDLVSTPGTGSTFSFTLPAASPQ